MSSIARRLALTAALALTGPVTAQAAIVNGVFTIESADIIDLYSATFDGGLTPCASPPGSPPYDAGTCAFFNGYSPAGRAITITPVGTGSGVLNVDYDSATGEILQVNVLEILLPKLTLVIAGATTVVADPDPTFPTFIRAGVLGAPQETIDADEGTGIGLAGVFRHDDAPNQSAPDFATFANIVDSCSGTLCALIPILSLDGVPSQINGTVNGLGGDSLVLRTQTANNSIYTVNLRTESLADFTPVVTTPVTGQLGSTIQTCLQLLTVSVSDGENCTYGGSVGPGFPIPPGGEAIGPNSFGYYYSSVTRPEAFTSARTFTPTPGDGKLNAKIEGEITVDRSAGSATDHLISFSLTISDPNGGKVIRVLNAVVERFDSATQTLAPRTADAVSANGLGGFDYIIGSAGFPNLLVANNLTACEGQTYGSFECAASFAAGVTDTNKWGNWPGSAGLGSLEGNLGAKTAGTVAGLECTAGPGATDGNAATRCAVNETAWNPLINGPNSTGGSGGAAEDVGWDQLLLKVVTDANGFVVSVEGFDVEEYRVFGQTRCGDNTTGTGTYTSTCNSWHSSYFTLTAVPVPAAAWLLGSGVAALGFAARRRKAA